MLFALAMNRVLVTLQRFLLNVNDIYFQGSPRIIGRKSIIFGKNFRCGKNAWIEAVDPHASKVKILFGDNFSASENFHIGAVNAVFIGNNVLVGSNVLITDHSHGQYDSSVDLRKELEIPPNCRKIYGKGAVFVEDNVWIADGVKILSGVRIGYGSIISANTVIRENIPAYTIYGNSGSGKIFKNIVIDE